MNETLTLALHPPQYAAGGEGFQTHCYGGRVSRPTGEGKASCAFQIERAILLCGLCVLLFHISLPAATFQRAVNLGGGAIAINGQAWESDPTTNFTANGVVVSYPAPGLVFHPDTFHPPVSAPVKEMLRTGRFDPDLRLTLGSLTNTLYEVYVWTFEDSGPLIAALSLQDTVVTNYVSGPVGRWDRLGPFRTSVTNGTLTVRWQCLSPGDSGAISGFELWRVSSPVANVPPVPPVPPLPGAPPMPVPVPAPGSITVAWDASATLGVTNYTLYASSTFPLRSTNLSTAPRRVQCGTNLVGQITNAVPAVWSLAITAWKDGLESEPNFLTVEMPAPVTRGRAVLMQHSIDLTNWGTLGAFRLKVTE